MMTELSICLLILSLLGGIAIGTIAGLLPGVHVNNTSAILLGLSPGLIASGIQPLYIAMMIISSTVSQSFLDIVPSIFLGAPDDATALAVMPGHRMLLDGRGIEAVRLSAAGSGLAIVVSLLLILPLSFAFKVTYPLIYGYMALILIAISLFIIFTSDSGAGKMKSLAYAVVIFMASGLLGIISFSAEPALIPIVGIATPTALLPLLSGLFGAPMLLMSAMSEPRIPRQTYCRFTLPGTTIGKASIIGTTAGAMVAWFPAVSSGVATSITGMFSGKDEDDADRQYLISVSGVNTSNAVFSLVALYVIGRPRSGAVAAAQEILGGSIGFGQFALFLAVVCVAGVLSYLLTLAIGGYAAVIFSRLNYRWLNRGVLAFLAAMCLLMTGAAGLAVFMAAAAVGLAAHILKARKTCLMGVLLLPCIFYFI